MLGETIANIRKEKGMKQGELAFNSSISLTYLSQIENNRKKPNISTLEKISKALEMPLPIIFFLSLDVKDIPENKRKAYSMLFPSFEALIKEFFLAN